MAGTEGGGIRPCTGSGSSNWRGRGAVLGRWPGSSTRRRRRSGNWVRQADIDEGLRSDGLTTEARKQVRELGRENQRLRMERDIQKKSHGLVREGERIDSQRGYAFMKAHRAIFPIAATCRVLGLSSSGYYDWLRRPPSARARRNAELKDGIRAKWAESGDTYGSPRIHATLAADGERTGRKRVARRRTFSTAAEASREVFGFIESFYKTRRLHSLLGYRSSANFERLEPCGLTVTCGHRAVEASRASPARSRRWARPSLPGSSNRR